ncbi:MAG: ABC transporter permease [Firmicutes bacterium]|jgi:putative ABC transport system permease protein|nr:ABC transporter permease [Bacillota bacterium]
MRVVDNMKIAAEGLSTNPMRSFLTSLGVIIGVAAVIIMVAIGEGASVQVSSRIQGLGANLLIVMPGRARGGAPGARGAEGSATTVDTKIFELLRSQAVMPRLMAPETSRSLAVTAGTTGVTVSIVGTTSEYFEIRNYTLASGTLFEEDDLTSRKRVAILGASVANELFGEEDPLGKTVRIRASLFRVIGVLEAKGQSGLVNLDDQIFVPLTTAQSRLFGNQTLRSIYIDVGDASRASAVQAEIEEILLAALKDENSFIVRNQGEIISTLEGTTRSMGLLLAGIAAVSLVVGGIGIMNIMLVSVTERTREIGIRKAIGAQRGDILAQFLLEAVALSLAGGIFGILSGWAGARIASRVAGWPTVVSVSSVLVACGFSLAVGLFFGVYPASKASALEPVEAPRLARGASARLIVQ